MRNLVIQSASLCSTQHSPEVARSAALTLTGSPRTHEVSQGSGSQVWNATTLGAVEYTTNQGMKAKPPKTTGYNSHKDASYVYSGRHMLAAYRSRGHSRED
uniref:SCP domain-containing protein n=1 Tax=Steinernema glaseri TaxID=37863 RepID=A0A1I7ZZI9_9BILA